MGLFWCLHSFLDVFLREIGVLFFGLYKNAVCRKTVEFSRDDENWKSALNGTLKGAASEKLAQSLVHIIKNVPKVGPMI